MAKVEPDGGTPWNPEDKAPIFMLLDMLHGIPEDKIREIEIQQDIDFLNVAGPGDNFYKKEQIGSWITIRMYVRK